jgi:hypothetical protein
MKIIVGIALAAIALAGCTQLHVYRIVNAPTEALVIVTPNRYIVVDREPIVVRLARENRDGSTPVVFRLAGLPNVKFDKGGITPGVRVKALTLPATATAAQSAPGRVAPTATQNPISCGPSNNDATEFTCRLPNTLEPGQYSYTVKLLIDGKPAELDPTWMVE